MSWKVEYPVLTTWLDLRPYHGLTLGSGSNWRFKTTVSFCYTPYFLWSSPIWNSSSYRVVNTDEPYPKKQYLGYRSANPNPSSNWNNFLAEYGLKGQYFSTAPFVGGSSGYHIFRDPAATTTSCFFLPSRPLAKSPEETFTSTGSLVTSLNGVSYKTSYGHHKTWSVSLYLDGALDAGRPEYFWDARPVFDNWLKLADSGVTLTLQRSESTSFYSRTLRTVAPYIDCPTNICGQLEQANLKFDGADNHCYRYKLDLTIHEAKGTNLYE